MEARRRVANKRKKMKLSVGNSNKNKFVSTETDDDDDLDLEEGNNADRVTRSQKIAKIFSKTANNFWPSMPILHLS